MLLFFRNLGVELYAAWRDNLSTLLSEEQAPSGHRLDVSRKSGRYIDTPVDLVSGAFVSEARTTLTSHQAATKIQRFWRKHIDMQVDLLVSCTKITLHDKSMRMSILDGWIVAFLDYQHLANLRWFAPQLEV